MTGGQLSDGVEKREQNQSEYKIFALINVVIKRR